MGSMGLIAKMLPGMNNLNIGDKEDAAMAKNEAIILSMTKEEWKLLVSLPCPEEKNSGRIRRSNQRCQSNDQAIYPNAKNDEENERW